MIHANGSEAYIGSRPPCASLAEVLAAIEPRIDVESDCFNRICQIAERFPAKASNFFGFERSLGRDDARVDFALGISERGAAWLRSEAPWPIVAEIFESCFEHSTAGTIRPWLEFDTSLAIDVEAEPSLYIGVSPRQSDAASMLALAQKLHFGDSRFRGTLKRCLDLLPVSVYCIYVGKMRGRGVDGVRLSIVSLSDEQLKAYLRRVEWAGNLDALDALLLRFASVSNRFGVQIDVGPEVKPYLGLELIADGAIMSERATSYNIRLLHHLVKEGMCSPSECAKLASWPSESTTSTPFIDSLLALARSDHEKDSVGRSFATILHHIKFALRTDRPLETKAYFGVTLK